MLGTWKKRIYDVLKNTNASYLACGRLLVLLSILHVEEHRDFVNFGGRLEEADHYVARALHVKATHLCLILWIKLFVIFFFREGNTEGVGNVDALPLTVAEQRADHTLLLALGTAQVVVENASGNKG